MLFIHVNCEKWDFVVSALNNTYNHTANGASEGSVSEGCSPTDKTRGYSFGDEAGHLNGSRGSSFTSSYFGDDVEDSGESSEDGAGDWLFMMDTPPAPDVHKLVISALVGAPTATFFQDLFVDPLCWLAT